MSNDKFSVKFMGLIGNMGWQSLFRISFFVGENNVVSVYMTAKNSIFCSNINKKTRISGCGSE
ncbi:hypothetical protein CKG00_03615 [Morganella morganii]|uniref:Uncharacterized protein n=1 Tax=Morganella morganii TaxID=582 RepID=A0A433ZTZ3_MORMO|nr:hypothetical protein CKG00_03615 [Morganella morganii]